MISVVTPTLRRPDEIAGLLDNLANQILPPTEIILVDGAPPQERESEIIISTKAKSLPFTCNYIRHGGGTAIQRNVGIDNANSSFIAFIDDDIRLEPEFFQRILKAFDNNFDIGGIVGYRTNQHFIDAERWRWYRRLHLFNTYEPGRYDYTSGYPINVNLQPPFNGLREVDFMTTSCAVWRKQVFDNGLRFDRFFSDYGMLEDAHLSLKAGLEWKLLQCGDARCIHLQSANARSPRIKIGYKSVINYYYVFQDIVKPLTLSHQLRFWRFQLFELFRVGISAIRRRRMSDAMEFIGRIKGIVSVIISKFK